LQERLILDFVLFIDFNKMNKSTPINQLPSQLAAGQNTFINDQQRQMITNAQHAITTSQMPQNTQLAPEIMTDDDAAIQDMLNNLNNQPELPPQLNQQVPVHTQEELIQRLAAANNLNVNKLMNGYGPQAYMPSQQQQQQYMASTQPQPFSTKMFMNILKSEVKLIGLVFVAVILVHFVPFHTYVGRYLAIYKIPYNEIILRAIVASLIVVIGKKLIG
jgi:hypothetical protein